jgi:hypothetical protein
MGVEESTGWERVCLSFLTPFWGEEDAIPSLCFVCRWTTYGGIVILGNARTNASYDCRVGGAPGRSPGGNVLRLRSVGRRYPYM